MYTINRLFITVVVAASLGACSKTYIRNPDFPYSGPMFVANFSIEQQNEMVIEALSDQGFETEETTKGVVIYLPPNIYFDGAKSDITLEAREKIALIADEVNKSYINRRTIEISGHTDSDGDAANNLELSKRRAEAASEELVFSRVDNSRLLTTWFGETAPRFADKNDDGTINEENKSRNRRVEFTILNPVR